MPPATQSTSSLAPTQSINPASALLQPSRPTTATSNSTSSSPPPSTAARFSSVATTPYIALVPDASPDTPLHNLLPIFTKYYKPVPGTVRIKVGQTTFFAHREVLIIASPFFESCLSGGWKETEKRDWSKKKRPQSDLQEESLPSVEEESVSDDGEVDERGNTDGPTKRDSFASTKTSVSVTHTKTSVDEDHSPDQETQFSVSLPDEPGSTSVEAPPPSPQASEFAPSLTASYLSSVVDEDEEEDDDEIVVARLVLKEEKASTFQDFLCHIYPRLECLITWNNAGDLCRLASKFDVPSLRSACIAFLLPSAAGKPVLAMKLAEDHDIPELYKEASRFCLDNYHNWPQEELGMLSQSTLLKLERRRAWFLERLLKLGLVQTLRDYVCQPACPDPITCARLVDEKWKSAWSSAFRFGTPQPSIIYRSLRSLEPSLSSPALHLPHTLCNIHAKSWVMDLFDRMFGIGITPARSWGALTVGGGTSGAGAYGRTFGAGADGIAKTSRYFLHIDMLDK